MLGVTLPTFISRALTLIIAFTVHEFAHAWTANQFGDDTPRANGRLTLNPLAHLDVMGSLMLLVAGFGWAKPVPVNPYALGRRSPAALMLVSLAGPLSNLLLAVLAAALIRMNVVPDIRLASFLPSASEFIFQFIIINITLMLFNLIPLAPLDGDKIADYFLPPSWQRGLERIRPYGPVILLVLLFVLPYLGFDVFGLILLPPLRAIYTLLVGG
jgi:Zn-dependent protease